MPDKSLEQRLNQLRRRGHPGVAPLWLETLPPGEAYDLAGGYDALWAVLMRARILIAAGRIEEAAPLLEMDAVLPPQLEKVRARLLSYIAFGRKAMSRVGDAAEQEPNAALRTWLERVRRRQQAADRKT